MFMFICHKAALGIIYAWAFLVAISAKACFTGGTARVLARGAITRGLHPITALRLGVSILFVRNLRGLIASSHPTRGQFSIPIQVFVISHSSLDLIL